MADYQIGSIDHYGASINAWYQWTVTTSATTIPTWQLWTATGTASSNVIVSDPWLGWQDARLTQPSWRRNPFRDAPGHDPVRQQQAEREVKRRLDADRAAINLLEEHLDEVQKRDYKEKRHFDVQVGEKTYRIAAGTHGNVYELHRGENGAEIFLRQFCIPSRIRTMPEPDVHLAQKLMLEWGAEDEFHRIANVTELLPLDRLEAHHLDQVSVVREQLVWELDRIDEEGREEIVV